jgi:hypothetical protein
VPGKWMGVGTTIGRGLRAVRYSSFAAYKVCSLNTRS